MSTDIKSFEELAVEIAMQTRTIQTQSKIIAHYRAKNYSIIRRNRFLVKCSRLLYLLIFILLLYIFIQFVLR